ncbi:SurA N-terminal domain-containing protein [Halobacillus litoralis]|uniref:SurA N-terminal domain-containing protein n=1 Tax=Halobacillus litoralis TaxID=45668 RepID=UPI001CD68ECB|nr:SurA N-terminal domain-containing protein [Halobacillus litoralis]MCA0972496.1 SurA N-terminal domain-containing protein [Halobacillus litoralis]
MTTTMNHKGDMTLNKKILSLLLVAFVALLAACSDGGEEAGNNNESTDNQEESQEQEQQQPEMPEPDVENVPDVVAEVNGTEITKEEFTTTYESQFQRAAMQSQMMGQELDQEQLKTQVAESLVDQELILEEAKNRDFTVSEEDVNKEIESLVEQQQQMESKEDFFATFEQQGMSKEDVTGLIENQILLNKIIEDEAGGSLQPTEEEIQESYDQFVAQQEQANAEAEVPSLEEVKPSIEQQLVRQKENEVYQTLAQSLREGADVTINL